MEWRISGSSSHSSRRWRSIASKRAGGSSSPCTPATTPSGRSRSTPSSCASGGGGCRGVRRRSRSRHGAAAERGSSVGGLQELVESAAGFGVLDLALLRKLLETYGEK